MRSPEQKVDKKEVYVKAHIRAIRQRVYRFVCKECQIVVERICYPSRPVFCERCRPPKVKPQESSSKLIAESKKKSRKKEPVSILKTS